MVEYLLTATFIWFDLITFTESSFEEKPLHLPKLSFLPNTRIDFPDVLVGDEVGLLNYFLIRKYPKEVLDDVKRLYLTIDFPEVEWL